MASKQMARRLSGDRSFTKTAVNFDTSKLAADDKRFLGFGYDYSSDTRKEAVRTDIIGMFKEAMACTDPNYLPVVAKVEWEFNGPLTPTQIESTLGDTIDQLASGTSVAGVQPVYSTPGLIDGQFQTYNLAVAVGSHFRMSEFNFEGTGAIVKQTDTPTVGGIIPDDWTRNDLLNGALGLAWNGEAATQPMFPARMQYNWWLACAFAAFIKAVNFRWSYGSLVNIFEDQLANTAFLQFMTQDGAAGSSQVDMDDIVTRSNAFYAAQGSTFDFRWENALRLGSKGSNVVQPANPNLGVFKGYQGDIVDVVYGGGGLRALFGDCCTNQPFRMLRKPYLLNPGVPPGLFYEASNAVQMDLFRRYMDISMGQEAAGKAQIPPILTGSGSITAGFSPDIVAFPNADLERTLDAPPFFVAQQRYNGNAIVKATDGGFMATVVLGWEIWRNVARFIENDSGFQKELQEKCGCAMGWTN